MSMKKANAPARWWQPPFSTSSDPAVRRAWSEFTAGKGDSPYSMGDAIEFMQRRIPQRAGSNGSSGGSEITHSQLHMGLARFLREMRA